MLVRFNKGPWHRRLQHLHDSEVARGVVNVAVNDKKFFNPRMYDTNQNTSLVVGAGYKIATYRVKMVTIDIGSGPRTIPSVYPDGAICFEHEGTY